MADPYAFRADAPMAFDYIVVGAGSAGCVMAARLSEDAGKSVLLLEYGGTDNSIIVSMPSGLAMPMKSKRFNWGLSSEPEQHLGGRSVNLPRGKGLGGSSSINGMCYVRGNPLDYELWAALGATGWQWRNVLPYFTKLERALSFGPLRGRTGPLQITRGNRTNPLYNAFIAAGRDAGYPVTSCMNELQHEGFGPMEMTVADGTRCSTARAYLHPASKRNNLTVLTHANVQRVLFEGTKATGIGFEWKGRTCVATTATEVILCAGSIMSPVILMRSGIGPAQELKQSGIPLVLDHSEVGENLMDHMEIHIQQHCTQPVTLSRHMTTLGKAKIGAQWLLQRSGLGATNHFEAGGHIRSRAGVPYPDIQYHFLPLAVSYDGEQVVSGDGFQVHVGTKRSRSRGRVALNTTNTNALPKVYFNYLSFADDWRDMRACIHLTREIFSQASLGKYLGVEIAPGPEAQDDDALDAFIQEHATTAHHPCGTCRMGDDDTAVVDSQCRVKGVQGLRVVDSSIFPQATAGDLNAPSIMVAERAADLVLNRSTQSAEYAPILVDPNWKTQQRSSSTFADFSGNEPLLSEAVAQVVEQTRPNKETRP